MFAGSAKLCEFLVDKLYFKGEENYDHLKGLKKFKTQERSAMFNSEDQIN